MNNPAISRLTWLVYLQQFTSECMPIYPFYAIMFVQRSGLSVAQVSALFAIWILVALVSEIPTGLLADRFSRRSVLVVSKLMQAAAFLTWWLYPGFTGYAVGFVLWGVGYAFNSGAFQAYVYEEMAALGAIKQFTKVFSRSQSLALVGMVVAYAGASLVGSRNYAVLLISSLVISLLSAAVAAAFPAETRRHTPSEAKKLAGLRSTLAEVASSPLLQRLVISVAIVVAIGSALEEYVPLYYQTMGAVDRFIPGLLIIGLALSAYLSWRVDKLERLGAQWRALLVVVAGAAVLVTSYAGGALAIIGLFTFMRLINVTKLLYEASLQHSVAGPSRATISSLPTFIAECLSLALVAVYGWASRFGGNVGSMRVIGGIVIGLGGVMALVWLRRSLPQPGPAAAPVVSATDEMHDKF
ncbi:MAG TPA: MFS transporter [Candidatus Saccharimonadia bacterium]|nr:MFS transporter [Candidatus Saccharimonadia bacterium]